MQTNTPLFIEVSFKIDGNSDKAIDLTRSIQSFINTLSTELEVNSTDFMWIISKERTLQESNFVLGTGVKQ